MKVSTRLVSGYAIVIALVVVSNLLALREMSQIQQNCNRIATLNLKRVLEADNALAEMQKVVAAVNMLVMSSDTTAQQREKAKIAAARERYTASIKFLEENDPNAKAKQLMEKMKARVKPAAAANNKAVALAAEGKRDEAILVVTTEAAPLITNLFDVFTELSAYHKERVNFRLAEAMHSYQGAKVCLLAGLLISVICSIVAAVLSARSVIRPLQSMRAMLVDISNGDGDLTKRLPVTGKDEFSDASNSFNLFVDKLQGIITDLGRTTVQVSTTSSQIHSTAGQMATTAEQAAAQAGNVATAGEEMAATSGEISQNCQYAAEGSKVANKVAMAGARVVEETVAVMSSIADRVQASAATVESLGARSDQIGEIVGTIEEIADQTNLLALNAAIEAARAGEQGRGFAVVADEVRALAERTTKATREIGEMIKAIQLETKSAVAAMKEGVSEVANGTGKAADSGKALQQILEQISSVTTQIDQVATAAEEQSATTSEISSNMLNITEAVQQTSQGAKESAVAAQELARFSEELQRLIGQFKVA
jgi:methyl-accepting chemotaxis protein